MERISLRTQESLIAEIEALKKVIAAHDQANSSMLQDEQTELESRIEITVNYISGFILAWFTFTWIVTPLVTFKLLLWNNAFAITMIFTVVSILRTYYWRRFFAKNLHKVVHKLVRGYIGW